MGTSGFPATRAISFISTLLVGIASSLARMTLKGLPLLVDPVLFCLTSCVPDETAGSMIGGTNAPISWRGNRKGL